MPKKVILLGLGDVYWTRFINKFCQALVQRGHPCVVVLESRLGEYQSLGRRGAYPGCSVYYLSDFVNDYRPEELPCTDVFPVYCDYLRQYELGVGKYLKHSFSDIASYTSAFADFVLAKESDAGILISDTVSTGISYAFNRAAERAGVAYWGLSGSRISGHFIAAGTIDAEADVVKRIYEDIVSGRAPVTSEEELWARAYLEAIDRVVPDYMKSEILNSVSLRKYFRIRYLRALLGGVLYQLLEPKDCEGLVIRPSPVYAMLGSLWRSISRMFKARYAARIFNRLDGEEQGGDYYIYPIHYQPEASTAVGSPYYCDQLSVIRNLAFSMPAGTLLYVKEHVSNIGFPSVSFYRALTGLPNVVLVSPQADMKSLIRHSKGVITLTGTAGFEALLLGRPAYYFGSVFYTYHSLATRLGDWSFVRELLAKKQIVESNAVTDTCSYLIAYKRYCFEGVLDFTKDDFGISEKLLEMVSEFSDLSPSGSA